MLAPRLGPVPTSAIAGPVTHGDNDGKASAIFAAVVADPIVFVFINITTVVAAVASVIPLL